MIKLAIRHFKRHSFFTSINVAGLTLGFAICLLIGLFIIKELSYDHFHTNADRIYRLSMRIKGGDYDVHWARQNTDWINQLPEEIPKVETLIRFQDFYPRNVKVGDNTFKQEFAYTTDAKVFSVFDFELLQGNPATALEKPQTVVLTQATAQKFFGNQPAMGQSISLISQYGSEKTDYQVTGIMKDLPKNTHLPVNMLTSFGSPEDRQGWAYTYLLLKNPDDLPAVTAQIPAYVQQHNPNTEGPEFTFPLQPLEDIHLQSNLAREIIPNGSMTTVYIFLGVGIFILIMTTINFINLNAAHGLSRIREVGVRKILGATPLSLQGYFIFEAILLSVMSASIVLLLVIISADWLTDLLSVSSLSAAVILGLYLVSILVGVAAGFYPALMLTAQKVAMAIKNMVSARPGRGIWQPKYVFVAVQFMLCIVLISGSLITRSQFTFLVDKNLGLDKNQVLAITGIPESVKFDYSLFKQQLKEIASIEGVSGTMEVPSREIRDQGPIYAEGNYEDPDQAPNMDIQIVDNSFIDLMDVELIAGRNFRDKSHLVDKEAMRADPFAHLTNQPREYILNETAMRQAGWQTPEEALGKQFAWSIGEIQLQKGSVIGIVKDYHQESLRNTIDPTVLVQEPYWIGNILVKISGNNIRESVASIESMWQQQYPEYPMEYAFVDDLYNQLYQTEKAQLELIYFFTGMALIIAFLGLFGLISYILKAREKELAIRRILGADYKNMIQQVSYHMLWLILVGSVFAIPLTWLGMEHWLTNFAYRIDINPVFFMPSILVVLTILIATVGLHLRKILQRNPASILRAD